MTNSNKAYVFDPMKGPATGVEGAWPFEHLQLTQIRQMGSDHGDVVSRDKVELKRRFHFKNANTSLEVVPVFAANMFGVGTLPMAEVFDKRGLLVSLDKHVEVPDIVSFLKTHGGRTAVPTVGFDRESETRLREIFDQAGEHRPKIIVLDVPNGHMEKILGKVEHYRKTYPDTVLFAGNIGPGNMGSAIMNAGADGVKCGIGPGSACTTKLVAGVHPAQFASIRDNAEKVHKLDGYVIGDGGIRTAGDAGVAFAGGADFVMIGGAFGAHDESGEPVYIDDRGGKWLEFMGSSSSAYMLRTKGEIAHYRAAEGELQWLPYKGSIDFKDEAETEEDKQTFLQQLLGGMRSACSYGGAHSMEEFSEMAKRTYRGEDGGLRLNKVDFAIASGGKNMPRIVNGLPNPVTGKLPNPKRYVPV